MFDETPAEAWRLRYGSEPGELPELGRFLSHRSVRDFSDEPIPESLITGLVAAAQSASTSSNLQLWSVVSVQEPERRHQISMLCGDQEHVRTCGWFFAFLADVHRIKEAAQAHGEVADGLEYAEFYTMSVVDAALGAERMVCAAESLGLGTCYIGGLRNDPMGVRKLLGMPEGTFGVFGVCIGWPKVPVTAEIKPRLAQSSVWFRERYQHAPDVAEYDERMSAFYASQNMKADMPWSRRSGRRVGVRLMTGREVLLDWLRGQGFLRR